MIIRTLSSKLALLKNKFTLPSRFQKGLLGKWTNYWILVGQDYKRSTIDLIKESRKKPLKTSIVITSLSGIIYSIKTNPNEIDFKSTVQLYLNESAMYGEKTRNKEVDNFYVQLIDSFNHGLVRRISFGVFSIIWIDNYSKEHGIYKSQCKYLRPRYLTFHTRIVDFGFLGRWWNIDRQYKIYDINEDEWNK
ncbi:Uncharacterized protein Anas_11103 [Armadillidium nasatum]|uniref:Mitochondrial import inner membrane translocase subunit Tim29 n=1 Tax=Armadillidium nasatum TaxID=96803 RepID=A0A5N5T4Q0_9CRUS|nr:Uncharacterized protein Anas_11103 [Armadillidium nasatum]